MATVHTNLTVGKTYAVTSANGCTVTLANGVEVTLQAGQDYFTPDTPEVVVSDDDATVVQVFNHAPGRRGSGGDIESDLNVGHAAADAVAAVCTLTLGDLATGGTLTDSNGQSVELEAPHAYATGSVGLADATAAGTITFGTHEAIEFEAEPAVAASALLTMKDSLPDSIEFGLALGGEDLNSFSAENSEVWTLDTIVSAINNADNWTHAPEVEASEVDGKCLLTAKSEYPGTAGNSLEVIALENSPFAEPDTLLSGGVNARTPQEVVDALNASEDCPAVAVLDEDEQGITFTADEYGVNDTITITGDLFENPQGMSGGHGDYTVAELVTAISGEFDDITPTAGDTEGTIVLTAIMAGADANSITYTATGCFGGGTVKQGSTTRGKNAVEQTAFKIYLNGAELFDEMQGRNNTFTQTNTFNGAVALNGPVSGSYVDEKPEQGNNTHLITSDAVSQYDTYISGYTSIEDMREKNPLIESALYGTARVVWDMSAMDRAEQKRASMLFHEKDSSNRSAYPGNPAYDLVVKGAVSLVYAFAPAAHRLEVFVDATSLSGYQFQSFFTENGVQYNYHGKYNTLVYHAPRATSAGVGLLKAGNSTIAVRHFYVDLPISASMIQIAHGQEGTNDEKLHTFTAYAPMCVNIDQMLKATLPQLVYVNLHFKKNEEGKSLVTSAIDAFKGCTVLPDNMFPKDWSSLRNGSGMFANCANLSAATANAILDSLPDWSGEETPTEHVITFTGTAAATAWAAEGADLTHITAAQAKGWTVEGAPEQTDIQ